MHILLTDVLTCPRCGPRFGLILLADRIEERRVRQGRLGCANCRESYPIRDGAVDLRLARTPDGNAASTDASADAAGATEVEAATRLAALLGLAGAQGRVAVAGPAAALAEGVAALVPGLEVVAVTGGPPRPSSAGAAVSPVAAAGLPFAGRALRGLALPGPLSADGAAEAVRVVAPGARIVVEPASPGDAAALEAAGAGVLLAQEGVVVASASAAGHPHGG